jgi:hypothetical protein
MIPATTTPRDIWTKTSSSTLMRNGGKASFVNFTQSTTFRKVNIKLHSQNLMLMNSNKN